MTSVGKLLALPPLVFIGLISYSLYLWHWPMLVFAKYWAIAPISEALRLMILAASMVLAALTWRYIETPFRKRTIFKRQVQIFAFLGSVTAILLLLGILVRQLHGFPNRFSPQAVQYAAGSNDQGIRTALGLSEALNGQFIELGSGDKHLPVKLFVWGDSHAMATLSLLNVLCEEHSVRGLAATRAGNAPLLGFKSQVVWRGIKTVQEDSIPYNDAVLAYIRKNHISNVVLAAKWAGYNYDSNTDADIARLHRCLIDTLNGLNEAGAKTWILGQVPSPGLNVPRVLSSAVIFGCKDPEGPFFPLTAYFKDRRIQDQIFDGISAYGATVLDPAKSFLNPENRLVVADGGKSLYFDDNHLSVAGAMKLRPLFEPIFESMVEKPVAVGR
jgi:hypothetical protein